MKKILLFVAIFAVIQNWDAIRDRFGPTVKTTVSAEDVVLYGTQSCPWCAKTRELFTRHGIAYTDHDIEDSTSAYAEFKRLGGKGVPLIVVRGNIIHGYDRGAILRALADS